MQLASFPKTASLEAAPLAPHDNPACNQQGQQCSAEVLN